VRGHLHSRGGFVRSQGGLGDVVSFRSHRQDIQTDATELRVLLAIVEVGGVPEVAAALGVAGTTVKTMSAACLKRPAPRDRLIWSSSSQDMRRRWLVDATGA